METISFKAKTTEELTKEGTPQELETTLKQEYHEEPKEEEYYKQIDAKLEEGNFVEAKVLTANLLKECIKEGKSLSPKLKSYILSDWYKSTQIEATKEPKEAEETEAKEEKAATEEPELKSYQNVTAIVVGRNHAKRIINVAWGRGQEGFFKWNFRTNLPNYNDKLVITFEQRETRGIMKVQTALPLEGEANFQEDFYQVEEIELEVNEAGEPCYKAQELPTYLFREQNIEGLQAGSKAYIHWIYKFQPRENVFDWTMSKVVLADAQAPKQEDTNESETSTEKQEPSNNAEAKQEKKHSEAKLETHSLIINDIPLRNGELTCRCLTNENELIYFRKSLTHTEINRLDKLIITGLVREEDFGKQFIKIEEVKLAQDEDFPETILRKKVRRLHKEANNVFLDGEQLAARKVQLLRLKHLMVQEQSDDLHVLVEEMFLYAVHIKDYEWTIASVKPLNREAEQDTSSLAPQKAKEFSSDKEKESLRQPWQVRVAYVTDVNKEIGRVEIVYGLRKKGYIALEDFPISDVYKGDWLGMKMLDGKEPMHEIVFNDIIRLDPNKRLPNTSKLIYKIRRGVLWYSEQDHVFKLHNAPISQELVRAMENPQYKDYFLVEEVLDYNEQEENFTWRPVKVEKFEYLEPVNDMEEHIYPHKFRQEAVFQKALANILALAPKDEPKPSAEKPLSSQAKAEKAVAQKPKAKSQATKVKAKATKTAETKSNTLAPARRSFCPQAVSKHRKQRGQGRVRGTKGLRAKRRLA